MNRTAQPKKHKHPQHVVKPVEYKALSQVGVYQTDHEIRRKYVAIQINGI